MCLYVDFALAAVAGILYLMWKSDPSMQNANKIYASNIPGIAAHGIGHGFVGYAMRNGLVDSTTAEQTSIDIMCASSYMEVLKSAVSIMIFWVFLGKASMANVSNKWVLLFAACAFMVQLFVPQAMGFTYVQTVLILAFSFNQLGRPVGEKDFSYATYPMFVGIPLTLVSWLESTQCSAFVKDVFYGHVVYDAYIPISMISWYIVNYVKSAVKVKKL